MIQAKRLIHKPQHQYVAFVVSSKEICDLLLTNSNTEKLREYEHVFIPLTHIFIKILFIS